MTRGLCYGLVVKHGTLAASSSGWKMQQDEVLDALQVQRLMGRSALPSDGSAIPFGGSPVPIKDDTNTDDPELLAGPAL